MVGGPIGLAATDVHLIEPSFLRVGGGGWRNFVVLLNEMPCAQQRQQKQQQQRLCPPSEPEILGHTPAHTQTTLCFNLFFIVLFFIFFFEKLCTDQQQNFCFACRLQGTRCEEENKNTRTHTQQPRIGILRRRRMCTER